MLSGRLCGVGTGAGGSLQGVGVVWMLSGCGASGSVLCVPRCGSYTGSKWLPVWCQLAVLPNSSWGEI
ncbi:MAG: hypothetical protein JWL86_7012 [Rhizobium sp.]|nr:hypothetical protein [Rhizobium sp.]